MNAIIAQKTTYIETFRLDYTLFTAENHYGIACAALDSNGAQIAEYRNPIVTADCDCAAYLVRLLAENTVFPTQIDDVLADARGGIFGAALLCG